MSPQQKALIITTDATMPKWRSKRAKLKKIHTIINEMDNAEITVEVAYIALTPHVVNGRVTHEWMDSVSAPLKLQGYEWVLLHMGEKQKKRWGIQPTLRGAAQKDYDTIGEAYFWSDENSKRNGEDQFVEVFCHEYRHLLKHGLGGYDDTHERHDEDNTLKGDFKGLDLAKYNPALRNQAKQVSIIDEVISVLAKLIGLKKKRTLYGVAVSYLGRDASPADIAPDELGCAESVSVIIRDILPDFPIIPGTWTLNERLKSDARFRPVTDPTPGTIIISPTGTSTSKKVPNGHVGILGGGDTIMSNDSSDGHWEQNYTLATWNKRWGSEGYQTFMYQLIK